MNNNSISQKFDISFHIFVLKTLLKTKNIFRKRSEKIRFISKCSLFRLFILPNDSNLIETNFYSTNLVQQCG